MKYILKSHRNPYHVTVAYGPNGTLTGIQFSEEISLEEFLRVTSQIDYEESALKRRFARFPRLITEVPEDLGFQAFWDAYGLKRNKKRAERLWGKMSEKQKTAALAYIPKYINSLKLSGVAQKYPDTYLMNEVWEDE